MFISSGILLLQSVVLNIFVPFIAGLLFLWLCLGKKRKGVLLYLLARFVGVAVVAHGLFVMQFVRFGVGKEEYLILLLILLVLFVCKIFLHKETLASYISTLQPNIAYDDFKKDIGGSSLLEKIFIGLMSISLLWFFVNSFIFTTNFPTYADDSFSNRNRPIVNILHDGGVKLFGARDEILARGRLGYPIHIAIYKAVINDFQGGYNDLYTDLFQWFSLFFALIFIVHITRQHTKNILWSLLPATLIISLPLVFIHSIESYHDLPVVLYALVATYFIFVYLQQQDIKSLLLAILLIYSTASLKIEGLIIYAAAAVICFLFITWMKKSSKDLWQLIANTSFRLWSLLFTILFFLPFQIVRMYHKLGFNPSSLETGEVVDSSIHREIFDHFGPIFFQADNYGPVLIFLSIGIYFMFSLWKKKSYDLLFLCMVPVIVFILFTLVFLLTNNYQWVLNQTTVNRVFTMSFVFFFSFTGLVAYHHDNASRK